MVGMRPSCSFLAATSPRSIHSEDSRPWRGQSFYPDRSIEVANGPLVNREIAPKRFCGLLFALVACCAMPAPGLADGEVQTPPMPERPAIKLNRWQEDWSVLADPRLRIEPLDTLKYIPLNPNDPQSYMSLGLTLRERFEMNNAPSFGVGNNPNDSYLLQRFQFHVDVRPDKHWQVFVELEDVRAFWKKIITPVDENPLDLRLAFVAYT